MLIGFSKRRLGCRLVLACANGRIEVERVDVAAKYAGRLAEVRVNEGAFVKKDEVLARINTIETLARLAAAKAAVHRAHQSVAQAETNITLPEADLKLAEIEAVLFKIMSALRFIVRALARRRRKRRTLQ